MRPPLGIGYPGGSLLLVALLLASFAVWYQALGTVSISSVASPPAETFYWITIMFSQTLGTALGDWVADSGLGYAGGAVVFGVAILCIAAGYFSRSISRTALFWMAFILTRPLGATVGDFLDKPVANGGTGIEPLHGIIRPARGDRPADRGASAAAECCQGPWLIDLLICRRKTICRMMGDIAASAPRSAARRRQAEPTAQSSPTPRSDFIMAVVSQIARMAKKGPLLAQSRH